MRRNEPHHADIFSECRQFTGIFANARTAMAQCSKHQWQAVAKKGTHVLPISVAALHLSPDVPNPAPPFPPIPHHSIFSRHASFTHSVYAAIRRTKISNERMRRRLQAYQVLRSASASSSSSDASSASPSFSPSP